jgi:hypothetical protein
MGDLEEYGFDSRGVCGGVCSPFVFDSYEDYLVKARLFTDRLSRNFGKYLRNIYELTRHG